jgi:hypothetical protein
MAAPPDQRRVILYSQGLERRWTAKVQRLGEGRRFGTRTGSNSRVLFGPKSLAAAPVAAISKSDMKK